MRKTDFKTNCRLLFETRNGWVGKCSRKLIWKKWRKPRWISSNLTKFDEEDFSVWEIQSTITNNNNKKMIMNLSHKFSKSIAMLAGIRLWIAKVNIKHFFVFQRLCDLFSCKAKLMAKVTFKIFSQQNNGEYFDVFSKYLLCKIFKSDFWAAG